MGELAPTKRSPSDNEGHQHFVTDTAGKANLSLSVLFDALGDQIRDGEYPLHIAVANGAPNSVIEMMVREADDVVLMTNKHGETPLHIALANETSSGDADLVTLLAGQGLSVLRTKEKRHGNLPIHVAAIHGCSVEVAKKLLGLHPNSIHEMNNDLKTPLDLALENGRCSMDIMRLLKISDDSEDVNE